MQAAFGPPLALIQGTLEAYGTIFKDIPTETCPTIRRGSIAWIDSGPEFFISLANHNEWKKAYSVFGSVLPEDMEIVEKMAQLPTKLEVWSVSALEIPVALQFQRIKTSLENLKLDANMDADSSESQRLFHYGSKESKTSYGDYIQRSHDADSNGLQKPAS